jgi:tetratricopeptide (TPR) repeat protein
MINHYSGDSDAAISLLEEGLATCREHNYRWPLARLSVALGQAMHSRGDYERSTELFSEAEATYSELGDQWGYAMACVYLGREAHRRGNMAEAIRLYKHALAIGIEIDHGFTRACSMAGLAGILGDQGRCYDAARLFAFAEKDADESLERYAVMVGIEESKAVVNATAPGAWELAWADGEAMSLQEEIDLAHSV